MNIPTANNKSYLAPYGADTLLFNGNTLDVTCTDSCADPALPDGNIPQDEPFATADGTIVALTYDNKLAAIAPGDADWAESAAVSGLRLLKDVAMAGGKGVASYDVNGADGDKIAFFTKDAGALTVTDAPVGITAAFGGVWTNGKVALVHALASSSGQGAVYGIKLP